jgi:hypothetical protein
MCPMLAFENQKQLPQDKSESFSISFGFKIPKLD